MPKWYATVKFSGSPALTSGAIFAEADTEEEHLQLLREWCMEQELIHNPLESVKSVWSKKNVSVVITKYGRYKPVVNTRYLVLSTNTELSPIAPAHVYANYATPIEQKVGERLELMIAQLDKQFGYSRPQAIGTIANALQIINEDAYVSNTFLENNTVRP